MSGAEERAHAVAAAAATAAAPVLPPLALAAAVACVAAAAALANCSLLAGLYKTSSNGLFSILLQLAVAEIALAISICPELWTYNANGDWVFGSWGCIVYRGLNVFATIASSYLIATVALHTLAVANLEEEALIRRNRRNDLDDEEIRSSRHSLVAASDSSTPPRTMSIEYRDRLLSIPTMQPSLFVWVLSLSLSIPDFTLASIVDLNRDITVCIIVDSTQRLYLYSILALSNLLLPTILILVSLTLITIKLRSSKKRTLLNQCESKPALKLSLWLLIAYLVLCSPRFALLAYNIYLTAVRTSDLTLIDNLDTNVTIVGLALSFGCLTFILIRPIFCIILLPNVKKMFTEGHRSAIANV